MKKITLMLSVLVTFCMCISLLNKCEGIASNGNIELINIGTGGTLGVYYPAGKALARIINTHTQNMHAEAFSTSPIRNFNLLQTGKVNIAFAQGDTAYYAFHGEEMFRGHQMPELRCLTTLYPETVQIIVTKRANIRGIRDLKGKRVAVGTVESATEASARKILAAADISYRDIIPVYISFSVAQQAIKQGRIDAAFVMAGVPIVPVQELFLSNTVELMSIDEKVSDELVRRYPFYSKQIVPAGTYQGQLEACHAVSVRAMLLTTNNLSENTAYECLNALYKNISELRAAHVSCAKINEQDALYGVSIPLARGASLYFRKPIYE